MFFPWTRPSFWPRRRFSAASSLSSSFFAVVVSVAPPLDFSLRRPSELAALPCVAAFMFILAEQVRFLPSRLSTADCRRHPGPPIVVRRLPPPDLACPWATPLRLLVGVSSSSHLRSFDGHSGAPLFWRRRVLRAPLPSPMLWLAASLSRGRFALAVASVRAPAVAVISVRPDLCYE